MIPKTTQGAPTTSNPSQQNQLMLFGRQVKITLISKDRVETVLHGDPKSINSLFERYANQENPTHKLEIKELSSKTMQSLKIDQAWSDAKHIIIHKVQGESPVTLPEMNAVTTLELGEVTCPITFKDSGASMKNIKELSIGKFLINKDLCNESLIEWPFAAMNNIETLKFTEEQDFINFFKEYGNNWPLELKNLNCLVIQRKVSKYSYHATLDQSFNGQDFRSKDDFKKLTHY